MKKLTTRRILALTMMILLIASSTLSAYAAETEVGPGEDFFKHINGEFLKDKKIDPKLGEWSVSSALTEETDKKVDEIIKELSAAAGSYENGSVKRKIAEYYLSANDHESRETAGLKGIQPLLDEVRAAKNIKELGYAWADISNYSDSLPVLLSFSVNPSNATRYIYYVCGDTTDIDFSDLTKAEKKVAKEYATKLMVASGETKAEAAKSVKGIMKYLSDMSYVSNVDYDKYVDPGDEEYHYYNFKKLQKLYSNLDLKKMMDRSKEVMDEFILIKGDKYIVEDPNFAKALNIKYLKNSKLEIMKDVTVFMLIDSLASQYECMPEAIQKANIDATNAMYGLEETYDFEKQALESTRFLLENEVGKLYTDKYFTEAMKQEAYKLVVDIRDAYRNKIQGAKWMSEKTKQAALKKLDNITLNVGYPDGEWGNEIATVEITSVKDGGDCLSNVISYLRNYGKPETPVEIVDKSSWPLGVTEVNAMYDPTNNSISIPAGILQAPFYLSGDDYNYAYNMGATGYTVAHEITHAFDNDGANYDEIGNYKNWWTKADKKKYKALQKKIIKYYSGYKILGLNVDGELTLPENIADLGGVECVVALMPDDEKSLKDFFTGYARGWASKYTNKTAKYYLKNDEHAPDSVRVNAVVSTLDEFYKAYGIKEGDKMYVAPEKRVHLWN